MENHLKNTLILSSCSVLGPSHPRDPPTPSSLKTLEFIIALIARKMPKRFLSKTFQTI